MVYRQHNTRTVHLYSGAPAPESSTTRSALVLHSSSSGELHDTQRTCTPQLQLRSPSAGELHNAQRTYTPEHQRRRASRRAAHLYSGELHDAQQEIIKGLKLIF